MSRHGRAAVRPSPVTLGLPPVGVDSHAHLDPLDGEQNDLSGDLAGVLHRAREAGVCAVGQVFMGPEAYAAGRDAFDGAPLDVFFLMAVHPCEAMKCTGRVMEAMRRAFMDDARLRAVGETGLDFYWPDCPHLVQEEAFRLHIAMARETGRPVVIHSRDAAADTLRILEAEGVVNWPVLWHCFSGDAVSKLERILANGWHVSVGGAVSYPANAPLRDALTRIPPDRMLLETDSPYLAPEPWRGKPNEPAFCAFTCAAIAKVLGEKPADVWERCGVNARRFFGI